MRVISPAPAAAAAAAAACWLGDCYKLIASRVGRSVGRPGCFSASTKQFLLAVRPNHRPPPPTHPHKRWAAEHDLCIAGAASLSLYQLRVRACVRACVATCGRHAGLIASRDTRRCQPPTPDICPLHPLNHDVREDVCHSSTTANSHVFGP